MSQNLIYTTIKTQSLKDDWKKVKEICKNNATGRKISVADAISEMIGLWIKKNQIKE